MHFRSISEKYDVSKSTAWSYVHKITSLLLKLSPNYIKWPAGLDAIKTMAGFEKRQGFPKTTGAIDGSHIPITPPQKQQMSYCNRKKFHSIILQAVCDSNYMFTDVFTGEKIKLFTCLFLVHTLPNIYQPKFQAKFNNSV